MWFAFFLGLIMTVICYIFTNQIVSVFLTEQSAFDYAVQFARILLSTSTLFGVFYVLTNALQAMGGLCGPSLLQIFFQSVLQLDYMP